MCEAAVVSQLVFPSEQIPAGSSDVCLTVGAIFSIKYTIGEHSATVNTFTKMCYLYFVSTLTKHDPYRIYVCFKYGVSFHCFGR